MRAGRVSGVPILRIARGAATGRISRPSEPPIRSDPLASRPSLDGEPIRMKRLACYCFAMSAALATAGAAAGHAAASVPPRDARLAGGGAGPTDAGCAAGAPGLVVHDDGLVDNGYNYAAPATDARFVAKFTPPAYPATFSRVCVSLFSDAGVEALDYEILVYADDGPGGSPGTLLGAQPVAGGRVLQLLDLPFTPRFESFDIADLGVNLESGSAYVGLRWNPSKDGAGEVYLSADESPATPAAAGYAAADGGAWTPLDQHHAAYRALMIRATAGAGGPRAPWLRAAFAPARIMNGETSTLSIRLSNVSQPSAAVLSEAFVAALPAGMSIAGVPDARTTCLGDLAAVPGAGTFSLAAGAAIPAGATCTIQVDVTASASGDYFHVIPAGALKTQHGDNAEAAQASLHVGYVFPEPYCDARFPAEVWPITQVTFAGIDQASDAAIAGSPALEDFTAVVGRAAAGQVLPMTVAGASGGPARVTAYVDWNRNGAFTDPGETYAIGELAASDGRDGVHVAAAIAVPATAAGATRLRVAKVTGGPDEPCNWLGFGQAEDYTLVIDAADAIFTDGFDAGLR